MQYTHYDNVLEAVITVFSGFLSHEEFVMIASETLEMVQETQSNKILVHTSQLKVMIKENQQWIEEVWFAKAKKLGVKSWLF